MSNEALERGDSPELTPGMRVGAIQAIDADCVRFFGFGVYDGMLPVPDNPGWFNPRITLDNGNTVWGYECWWGTESEIWAAIGGRTIIEVQPEV